MISGLSILIDFRTITFVTVTDEVAQLDVALWINEHILRGQRPVRKRSTVQVRQTFQTLHQDTGHLLIGQLTQLSLPDC